MSRTGLARWRVPVGYPVALACFWLAEPTPRSLVTGAAVAVVGLLIRAAAAGHLRKGEQLATTGPYAWTRNPLYFGSAFLAAGFAIAAWSAWVVLLVGGYFLAFYPAVMRREEHDLRRRFGPDFEAYAARVPLFFPRLRAPEEEAAGEFSWKVYLRNREYRAALGLAVVILLLWLRMRWG